MLVLLHKSTNPRGFALLITISPLVLLSLMAVRLLTLSTVSVRTAASGETARVAQANVRLGKI